MTESYRNYTFSIGDSPERTYKGRRAPISEGQTFAFGIVDKWKMIAISFIADAQEQLKMAGGELTEAQKTALEVKFVLTLCQKADLSEIVEQGGKILKGQSTLVIASENTKNGGSSQTYALSDKQHFDNWFEKYPGDLIQVYGYAIWNNVKPFISSFTASLMTAVTVEEQQSPLDNMSS